MVLLLDHGVRGFEAERRGVAGGVVCGDDPDPLPRLLGPVHDRDGVHVVEVEGFEVGSDRPDPAVELAERVGVRGFAVAAVREDVGLSPQPEVADAAVRERVDLVDHRPRRAERGVAVHRLRAERTPVGAPPGGFEFADQVVGVVGVVFHHERAAFGPPVHLVVAPVPVLEPLQPVVHEVVRRGLDVAHREEVVVEVAALHLLGAGVLLADAEPDRAAHHRGSLRDPREFAHLVGFGGCATDVAPGDGHAADVDEQVGVGHVGPLPAVLAEFVDGVVGDVAFGDAGVDEGAGREPGVRGDVRRHAEVCRLVDVAVDERHREVGRVGHTHSEAVEG